MTTLEWALPECRDTERLGRTFARHCPWTMPGARLLFLTGELGSGKTTLAAALLAGLGVTEAVRSPTYALIELYSIRAGAAVADGLAVHADLYRLQEADELRQLGLRDYLTDHTLLIVEWAERAGSELPRPDLWLRLEVAGEGRRCRADAHTSAGARWAQDTAAQLAACEVQSYVQPDSI